MTPSSSFEQPHLATPFQSIKDILSTYRGRHPDKIALHDLDNQKSISWGQLHDWANRVARYLNSLGIKKGDRIGLLSDEGLEKMIIWMGIWRLGAVVCPLNIEINTAHISSLLKSIGPQLVLGSSKINLEKLTSEIDCQKMTFCDWSNEIETATTSEEFFSNSSSYQDGPEVDSFNNASDMSCIFCTSGTTSRPKCVVYDHMAYWLNGQNTIDFLGLTAEDKTLEYRSFGWNSAQVLSLMPWIETGLSMYIANRFSKSRFFEWIKEHQITFSAGVPTVVNMLLNEPTNITAADIPSLRLMTCSTAPLSPEQWKKFEEMYGVTLLQLYGMSEAGWICGNRHYKRRMGTVGPPAKHQEFLVIDPNGESCPPNIEGEVTIGGPQTCIATISPEGEWEDMQDVRIPTGDLATIDEDGFVTVTGRTKDLIIRGGVNIAPLEIDNVIMGLEKVGEAAAVGIPDKIYGEEVICYVVPRPGEHLTEAEILNHCANLLPEFKAPKKAYLLTELPKSDRGKILRDQLKELWVSLN